MIDFSLRMPCHLLTRSRQGRLNRLVNAARRTRLILNSINSPSLTFVLRLIPLSTAVRLAHRVLLMAQSITQSTKANCAGSAKCVRLVLQPAGSDFLCHDQGGCLRAFAYWQRAFCATDVRSKTRLVTERRKLEMDRMNVSRLFRGLKQS